MTLATSGLTRGACILTVCLIGITQHEVQGQFRGAGGQKRGVGSAVRPEVRISFKSRGALKGHAVPVRELTFSADGKLLATLDTNREPEIRVWELASQKMLSTRRGRAGAAGVVFSSDGTGVASGSSESAGVVPKLSHTVQFWDARRGGKLRSLRSHAGPVTCLAITRDGKRLASGGVGREKPGSGNVGVFRLFRNGGEVRVWELGKASELRHLIVDSAPVASLAFNPSGSLLAAASIGGTMTVWETGKWKQLKSWKCDYDAGVAGIAFSADGRQMVTAGAMRVRGIPSARIEIWDVAALRGNRTGGKASLLNQVPVLGRQQPGMVKSIGVRNGFRSVESAVFHPTDPRVLVTVCNHKTVTVWDVQSGKQLASLTGQCIAFSRDGRNAAMGQANGNVQLFDVRIERPARTPGPRKL
jgi:WD domain, G-beta repeat